MPTARNANARLPVENADTVSLVCALLARFPELASIRSLPADGTVRLTFAIRGRLDRAAQRDTAASVQDHIAAFVVLSGAATEVLLVDCESERSMSFIHVTRDLDSFSKEELDMLCACFNARFGEALVCTPREETFEEDELAQDEAALYAIEALRDPTQSKSLVGFREEKRVLVYFLKAQKKAKAPARR